MNSDLNKIGQDMVSGFSGTNVKEKILNGIKTATEKLGIKLVKDEWGSKGGDGSKWNCACALGCMLVANNIAMDEDDSDFNEANAADFLGVDKKWVEGFVYGFDESYYSGEHNDAFQMGVELRKQFNVKPKDDEEVEEDDEE